MGEHLLPQLLPMEHLLLRLLPMEHLLLLPTMPPLLTPMVPLKRLPSMLLLLLSMEHPSRSMPRRHMAHHSNRSMPRRHMAPLHLLMDTVHQRLLLLPSMPLTQPPPAMNL